MQRYLVRGIRHKIGGDMAAELEGVFRVAACRVSYGSSYASGNVPEESPVSGRLWASRGPLPTRGGAYDYRLIPYWKALLSQVRQDRDLPYHDDQEQTNIRFPQALS